MDEEGNPVEGDDYSADDLTPDALAECESDCADFLSAEIESLREATKRGSYNFSQAGGDFWLTRNGHGAGFWDRGLGALGEALSASAKVYGSVDIIPQEDGTLAI